MGYFVPALHHTPEVIRYLKGEWEAYCVIEAEWYQHLGELTGQWFSIMARQKFNGTTLLLISNQ
jgi:hypothetical protein